MQKTLNISKIPKINSLTKVWHRMHSFEINITKKFRLVQVKSVMIKNVSRGKEFEEI